MLAWLTQAGRRHNFWMVRRPQIMSELYSHLHAKKMNLRVYFAILIYEKQRRINSSAKLIQTMTWDFEDIFFVAVISSCFLLVLWLISCRSRLRWSNSRVGAFYLSVYCFGAILLLLFEIAMSFVGPAEIQGQVSQLNLRFPMGRNGDHSRFEVTSPNGLRLKLASENHIAEHLRIGETVYVRYNPLASEPEKVERLDGPNPRVLFDSRNKAIFRFFPLINFAMLLVMATGAIYGIRKFRLTASRQK
jgi:hypothetical protein